ncbi:MAG: hypothetical protein ACI9K2_001916 [Myxococcota bacterium]
MGILVSDESGRVITLAGRCLIGRSASCFLRLQNPRVSSEHARLRWTGTGWELRDLGSRNGTSHNGTPLVPGQPVNLASGDQLVFGGGTDTTWTLADLSAPVPAARENATGRVVVERDGMLTFPGADPFPYLTGLSRDTWILEFEDEQRTARDGDIITVAGRSWTLHLPSVLDETITAMERPLCLLDLGLQLAVSADEEFVTLTVRTPTGAHDLGSRSHHYLLLTLARRRLADEGWVYADELARMLGLDDRHVNVQIFRARHELAELGVVDAAALIERRRGTRQLRLGTPHVTISAV